MVDHHLPEVLSSRLQGRLCDDHGLGGLVTLNHNQTLQKFFNTFYTPPPVGSSWPSRSSNSETQSDIVETIYCSVHLSLSKVFCRLLFYYFLFLAETFMICVNVFYGLGGLVTLKHSQTLQKLSNNFLPNSFIYVSNYVRFEMVRNRVLRAFHAYSSCIVSLDLYYSSFHISLSKAFWRLLFYSCLFLAETSMMRVNVFCTCITRNKISVRFNKNEKLPHRTQL